MREISGVCGKARPGGLLGEHWRQRFSCWHCSLESAASSSQSFETQGSLDAFTEYLDGRIPQLLNQYDVPGVGIALVRDGELVWSGVYGYADLEHERPMTIDAICRAESISKSITAWGVMRLVEQGLVGLDDPVQQYLGTWALP